MVTICQVGNTTNCPVVYVTVEQSGAGQLSFSQNNVSVVNGQNLPITISGGNGSYQISSNSNANIIQASISGSVLTLSTGSTSGSSSITVCSSDVTMCGVVTATAGSASSVADLFQQRRANGFNQSEHDRQYLWPVGRSILCFFKFKSEHRTSKSLRHGAYPDRHCARNIIRYCLRFNRHLCIAFGNGAICNNRPKHHLKPKYGLHSFWSKCNNHYFWRSKQPYFISGGTSSVSQETLNGNILTVYGIATGTSSANVCSSGGGCVVLAVTVNGGSGTAAPVTVNSSPTAVTTTVATTPAITTTPTTPSYTFTKYLSCRVRKMPK